MNEQQPTGYQQPQDTAPSVSGLAIAGLVLGIIALVSSIIPIVNNVSFFMGIIGLVLSIVGLAGINKGKHSGKGIAIAGIVLGIVSVVAVLLMQAACASVLNKASNTSTSGTSAAAGSSAAASTASASSQASSSEYAVTIEDATVQEDYKGNPALVVTYSWQNNSNDTCSFASALMGTCFQNGVQLDTAIVTGDINSEGYLAQVKPGSGTTVQIAYSLKDNSPVEVEVKKLISFDDTALASKTFEIS